jgi:Xaa-Pro aminopeptidase
MEQRIRRLREALGKIECEAYFSVSPPANQYLTGFLTDFGEISAGVMISQSDAVFMTDSRYSEQAKDQVHGYTIEEMKGDLLGRCGERLNQLTANRVAFDPGGLTVAEHTRLSSAFQGELKPDSALVSKMRLVKSAEEIDAVRQASELAEGVMLDIVPTLREGITEREVAATFEFEFRKRGATGPSFGTIALFGARASLPHGEPGDTSLKNGDIVLLDFGCRRGGYCSDLTRTFVYGSIPGSWFEEIYETTRKAQLAALEAVRPGAKCRDVDAVARTIIENGGYGDYFGHGLGHGVGIEVHEGPRVSTRSDDVLEPGMVVTVEPGIYVPGKGGVRIEDLVVVTESDCDVLTTSPKELEVLAR